MGRAIVRDPQVFLFDEPLSNLDAKLRVQMRTEIKELHQRLKTTSIYVTHDQIEAMTMADKIVVMRDGRIEQTGAPLELYDHPANLFVAGFIGSPAMNFLPGTLRRAGNAAQVELADGTRWAAGQRAAGVDGQPVIYGTRPEHLELASSGGIPTRGGGGRAHRRRHLRRLPPPRQPKFSVVFRDRHDFAPGSTIHLRPDLQRAHLFDAGSGQRLAA
jgi:multiple sugar transport system ATP-binding protein